MTEPDLSMPRPQPRIAIIGAGIIGMGLAFELAVRRGVGVTIFDIRQAGRGASWAAAGMIAPAFEAAIGEGVHPRLFDLCLESAQLWPEFAADLERVSGLEAGFRPSPALAVAMDEAEAARLTEIAGILEARDVGYRLLEAANLRALEPSLAVSVRLGLELETDTRINNRLTVTALRAALEASDKVCWVAGAAPLQADGSRVFLDGFDRVVVAAGWETPAVMVEEGGAGRKLAEWVKPLAAIDCYGGQMLSVAAGPGAPERVVRCGDLYLVPRAGQVVIGATMEPHRWIGAPEDEAIESLRRAAVALCPGLEGAEVTERWAGVRPGTPDHAPFLGETGLEGLLVAAGHYRNGILLTPVTAKILADQLLGKDAGALAAAFSISRAYASPR